MVFFIVLANAVIGFAQETMDALSKSMEVEANVVRDGSAARIPADQLVPGDIVTLQSGDKVPADLRLLKIRELQVDESALTGESVPVRRQTASLLADTVLADRTNLAFSSTLVTYGTGSGVVTTIGDHTEIGHINQLLTSASVLPPPLTRKIHQFSHRRSTRKGLGSRRSGTAGGGFQYSFHQQPSIGRTGKGGVRGYRLANPRVRPVGPGAKAAPGGSPATKRVCHHPCRFHEPHLWHRPDFGNHLAVHHCSLSGDLLLCRVNQMV